MSYEKKRTYGKKMKVTSWALLVVLMSQLLAPNVAMALTTGPSQPEVTGFEPVGTTDMVDMFTGSFVYNIPLMDVEGYPVNIAYHGGVTMEQEASWVGLGWSLNPGVINRSVRGVPDDFNGDSLLKDFYIKPEKNVRVGISGSAELLGSGDPDKLIKVNLSLSLGAYLNSSNYRGISCDFDLGGGVDVGHYVSAGVNIGVGSQSGASIDYNAGLSTGSSNIISKDIAGGMGVGVNVGGGYNTRSGLKDLNFSIYNSSQTKESNDMGNVLDGRESAFGFSSGGSIPIGVKNIVPVITNSSAMNTIMGRIKLGPELSGGFLDMDVDAMVSVLTYNNDASRDAYGYMYLQNASVTNNSILDFTRDKDGMFNKSMQYLPVPNLTYDIYSVSGQGTGGVFRPYRNDFGDIYDPATISSASDKSVAPEGGLGDLFEGGADVSNAGTIITAGPWSSYQRLATLTHGYTKTSNGSLYENVYFKAGGELTSVNPDYFAAIGGTDLVTPDDYKSLPITKPGAMSARDPRANLIYYHTAQEDTTTGVGLHPGILSYSAYSSDYHLPSTTSISRIGTGNFQRKKDQISEIVQVQKDGRKYVYGIPAMNNVQKEVTFSVDASDGINLGDGAVKIGAAEATTNNRKGRENYYSSTITPSYAHSYLLTDILSSDYTDVTGDGPTDDDLGTYTKFNYTRTDNDYRWVAPYPSSPNAGYIDSAQYNPGFWADPLDDKGSYLCGSREQWYLQSIETKNYIAEFYTSPRQDALGVETPLGLSSLALHLTSDDPFNNPKSSASQSYELDSIKLYNKHDRFINGPKAVPIKSVFFAYAYPMCPGLPNVDIPGHGKLTLLKIYFSYGSSQKSMISPYMFAYSPENPSYNLCNKDRWGNYKPSNAAFTNYEFPYVNQNDPMDSAYASAWSLQHIVLPSGGTININYESNDYAFVQDQSVNEMFMLQGLGNSPSFVADDQLFQVSTSPCLYAYFQRRQASELPGLSFAQNYLGTNFKGGEPNCMYFNFNVRLTGANNTYEQVKGYGNVSDIGVCPNDTSYGYVKFIPVTPTGEGGTLNPVTYTALNTARYNLPQIIYPGSNPDESDLMNVLAGLKAACQGLVNSYKSPVLQLVQKGGGKVVNLNKSYMRLQSVGLRKKGGGQRVQTLTFNDNWTTLAGGNEQTATYGKKYDYTIIDPFYGKISSGVASYEPLIGGDENPLRQPVPYIMQSGSNFPPNDPVDLYQEMPIGESLFPPAVVGYSQVTVSSIHAAVGKSSQGVDQYQFYTARDFPAQVIRSGIDEHGDSHYDFFSQTISLTATQGYTLIFNDMHGKPKKVEHDVYNPSSGTMQLISYQQYTYHANGKKLDNMVKTIAYNGANMAVTTQQLGVEADVTLDTRQKDEVTNKSTINFNDNGFILPIFIPIPIDIPLKYTWNDKIENKFQSAVVAKVVQQYGILDNVQSYSEGAVTTLQNELYDPYTGQPVVTSITNEFKDKEYTTNIPAWWVYKGMGPSYSNIRYKDTGTITVDINHVGTLNITNTSPLLAGDELSVSYTDSLHIKRQTVAKVLGIVPVYALDTISTFLEWGGGAWQHGDSFYNGHGTLWVKVSSCMGLNVLPRFPQNTPGWNAGDTLTNVSIEVINSGQTNMLNENAESYTSMDYPIQSGSNVLNSALTSLISLSARTFADSNTMILHRYVANADSVNPWYIGERGAWRLQTEYAYKADRSYPNVSSRNEGLFNANNMLAAPSGLPTTCYMSPYNYFMPSITDPAWHAMRTVTKYSPSGKEIENVDAIGNYSTAIFGFNEELPVAVASNAKQGDVFTEGFEDYNLLRYSGNILNYRYSFFNDFDSRGIGNPYYDTLRILRGADSLSIVTGIAHTGTHSLFVPSVSGSPTYSAGTILANLNSRDSGMINHYNNYFPWTPAPYQFTSANEYLPFELVPGKTYIISYWIKQARPDANIVSYPIPATCLVDFTTSYLTMIPLASVGAKSGIIDGWQQVEATFTVPPATIMADVRLPAGTNGYYVDDMRIYPANANMKAFVYNPYSEKLMATLDENNFATFYEYDQEGNLAHVKKETTKGVVSISESRSGNPKH